MVRHAWVLAFAACWGGGKSKTDGTSPVATADEPPPVASPGLIAPTNNVSPTFRRGLVLADKGDSYAALIELFKVQEGETGDGPAIRTLATYNLGTIALELGLYSIALAFYEYAIDKPVPELMPAVATGLGAVADRIGARTASGLEQYVGRLPSSAIDNADPKVRPQLQYLKSLYAYRKGELEDAIRFAKAVSVESRVGVPAANLIAAADARLIPAEGDRPIPRRIVLKIKLAEGEQWVRLADERDRLAGEIAILDRAEPAFRTSAAMVTLLQELVLRQALVESDCEKVAENVRAQAEAAEPPVFALQFCPPPGSWTPPARVTRTPLRTIAITEPEPPPAPVVADRDKDGVPDAADKCPDVIGNGADGCVAKPRDIDNDGVPDSTDQCPGVAGSADNKGCPADKDSDGDGVLDSKDGCKAAAGPVQTGGCPDGDRDGIADIVDACPNVSGTIAKGPRAGCKPAPNPKCARPAKPTSTPTGYACGDGKAKINVGCSCPAGQFESRDEGAAICWIKPAGC